MVYLSKGSKIVEANHWEHFGYKQLVISNLFLHQVLLVDGKFLLLSSWTSVNHSYFMNLQIQQQNVFMVHVRLYLSPVQ